MKKFVARMLLVCFCLTVLMACTPTTPVDNTSPEAEQNPVPTPAEPSNAVFQAGTYTAQAKGNNDMVTVAVVFDGVSIVSVTVTDHKETAGLSDAAIADIPQAIVNGQSIQVDTITGATNTSKAVLAAVENCISQAGGDASALKNTAVSTYVPVEGQECDVVVVGGGLAGIAAAISAAEEGASVILLEKLAFLGGNSILATGGFYIGGTDIQKAAGIEDSSEAFYRDAMASDSRRDQAQVRLMADRGAESISWMQSLGVAFSDTVVQVLGSTVPRAHTALPDSPTYLKQMQEAAEDAGVIIHTSLPVVDFNMGSDGAVIGVIAKDASGNEIVFASNNVVLACGGFGADQDRMARFMPSVKGLLYAGSPGTTGELIELAMDLGADTMDLDAPWLTPTVEYETKELISSGVLSRGGILVDTEGNRFTDETASYFEAGSAVMEIDAPYIFEVFDHQMHDAFYKIPEYIQKGMVTAYDTLDEMAADMGIDAINLKATVEAYNKSCENPASDPFGRKIYEFNISTPPYYCARVYTGYILTPGGLKINEECRVLKKDGRIMPGLFAVGESTGGYRAYGYIGGDSLAHAVVTGRLAGQIAATK